MVSVFAPVNIAWIKYMGKESGRPSNRSFSMTLDHLGTKTKIRLIQLEGKLNFNFSLEGYVPPASGQIKSARFLSRLELFQKVLEEFGFHVTEPSGVFEIVTQNNIPAGAGIASSASGYAALTLAWFGVLSGSRFSEWRALYRSNSTLRANVAAVSALGSGSSCRSFGGPFVEWDPGQGVFDFSDLHEPYVDLILLLDEGEKAVSSSEAHERVRTSSEFGGRAARVRSRMSELLPAMKLGKRELISRLVWDEAMDMHELFHTSVPSFSYWNERSRDWLRRLKPGTPSLPSANASVTMDAGANIHVFVPKAEVELWLDYLKGTDPKVHLLRAESGMGADYDDEG